MLIDPIRTLLAERAERYGCVTRPVIRTYTYEDQTQTKIIGTRLYVNDWLCAISWLRTQAPDMPPGGYTAYAYSTLSAVDAVLIYLSIAGFEPRIYVVPANELQLTLFADSPARIRMRFFVPALLLPPFPNRVDFWPYADAWHLLAPEREKKAA